MWTVQKGAKKEYPLLTDNHASPLILVVEDENCSGYGVDSAKDVIKVSTPVYWICW